MVFAHDTELALVAAVALVNSAQQPDTLETTGQLEAFYDEQGYTGRLTGDQTELDELRELRPGLRRLLTSSRDDAVATVNTMLREAGALPQLVRHGDMDWHLHAVEGDRPFATRIVVETAMAMIDVIRADEMSRLGVCADDDCGGLVLDLSRNRSRRFCSTACGNRAAVAAYRARQGS
ncbi:CGNR zinc finger domain-containing protein [Aeromicrobium fastidiosum]|uniref:CGNR zinc finger domain-containing protein n=1 Tax=Aeromicrobium fastidiosum TaxID=52699 RepID=A0A641AUZ7_9ACTN|nr:CGNR zinc finger domain-containing protein [Aeromicrobium fastidiosum]KAA1380811.1 CGNR zinc finger domain-containing protein [Aeromicrobium fastidiosum]MBP2390435.1 putative RNA-binding Zn ribbon-like protein [Aeromicrobium fastidiosum]